MQNFVSRKASQLQCCAFHGTKRSCHAPMAKKPAVGTQKNGSAPFLETWWQDARPHETVVAAIQADMRQFYANFIF
jgi:hypothetical protein